MNLVRPVFTEYERQVLHEIASRRVHPPTIQRFLDAAGRPVGRLFQMAKRSRNPLVHGLSNRVRGWLHEGLIQTVRATSRSTSSREVLRRAATRGLHVADVESMRYLQMSELDELADSFRARNRLLLGLEGAALGSATTLMEGVPGAQLVIPSLILADVTASLALLARQACVVASVYGFPSARPENMAHILGSLAPHTDSTEDGYFTVKTAVAASIREAAGFTARAANLVIDRQLLEREAPQMIRLIGVVADRLGVTITQKELGILVPVAGAVLNSSLNMAFQHVSYQQAKDYFRLLLLEDRYGPELVAVAIAQEEHGIRHPAAPARS